MNPTAKRLFDIAVALALLITAAIPMLLVALLIKLTSRGPALYWSDRVGRDERIFQMPKFRSMRVDTPQLATHLLIDSRRWQTPIGSLIRKTSLDELPQLWSVLTGDMSLVGPRPALFNQHDLIVLRAERGVHRLSPGLTGWAQINGRDELAIPDKVDFDVYYMEHQSFSLDLKILFGTIAKVLRRDGIKEADQRPTLAPPAIESKRAA